MNAYSFPLPHFCITAEDPILCHGFWKLPAGCYKKFMELEAAGCENYLKQKDALEHCSIVKRMLVPPPLAAYSEA